MKAQRAVRLPRTTNNSPMGRTNEKSIDIIDLSFDTSHEDAILRRKQPAKDMFKVVYGLGMTAERKRLLEVETEKMREERLAREKEEAEKNAFKERVFSEHECSSRRSTQSSLSAGRARRKMTKTIRLNKELVVRYDKAIENFE